MTEYNAIEPISICVVVEEEISESISSSEVVFDFSLNEDIYYIDKIEIIGEDNSHSSFSAEVIIKPNSGLSQSLDVDLDNFKITYTDGILKYNNDTLFELKYTWNDSYVGSVSISKLCIVIMGYIFV